MAKSGKHSQGAHGRAKQHLKGRVDSYCINESDGTITFTLNDQPGETIHGALMYSNPGSGSVPVISSGDFTENPPGHYTLRLKAGPVTANPLAGESNRFRQFTYPGGNIVGAYIAAKHCGSGSRQAVFLEVRCPNCDPQRPVPVALHLNLEVAASDALPQPVEPTRLDHSGDAQYACCWFSQPVDFPSDGGPFALWMLQKADPYTWKLTLRRGESSLVSFELKTTAARDCQFPLELQRVDMAEEEAEWPMTVTIVSAP